MLLTLHIQPPLGHNIVIFCIDGVVVHVFKRFLKLENDWVLMYLSRYVCMQYLLLIIFTN